MINEGAGAIDDTANRVTDNFIANFINYADFDPAKYLIFLYKVSNFYYS